MKVKGMAKIFKCLKCQKEDERLTKTNRICYPCTKINKKTIQKEVSKIRNDLGNARAIKED